MFSSNQILKVSDNLGKDNIKRALNFALEVSGNMKSFTRKDKPAICTYQIAKSGKYCIGWGWESVPSGWSEFPFYFDTDIISAIIEKHLDTQDVDGEDWGDGSKYKGFLMEAEGEYYNEDIENSNYAIVSFRPYTTFYAK